MKVLRSLTASIIIMSPLLTTLPVAHAETLAEVFALAKQNDAVMKAQDANYEANKETAALARSALLPQAAFTGSRSKVDNNNYLVQSYINPSPPPSTVTTKSPDINYKAYTYGVTVTQKLFDVQSWFAWRSGESIASQAEAQHLSDQQQLIIRVTQAYTDVLNAIDAYNTAKAEEAAMARQLDQTKQRFDVGLVAITDVYDSQASYDAAVVNSLGAKGQIGIMFEALENLTGQPIQSIAPLSDDFVVKNPEPANREEWVSNALEHNADLKVSEFAREAAYKNAESKTAAHLPTVTGSYQHTKTDSDATSTPYIPAYDMPAGVSQDNKNEVFAISLTMPLFAGGGISASRRQAWDQYYAAQDGYESARRGTVQAARSYHLAVTTDVARVTAQKQAILSAQSALDATQAGYEAGTRNIVDVLLAERALYETQHAWQTARYQFINDYLKLKKVSGNLTPEMIQNTEAFLLKDKPLQRSEFDN